LTKIINIVYNIIREKGCQGPEKIAALESARFAKKAKMILNCHLGE
jgi:hypothetical protein